MSEYYCPNCGADLENQPGFAPDAGGWTCSECGQFLTNPEDVNSDAQFDGVGWFCDGCGAFLNKQDGFNDLYGKWTCIECGYENQISENDIYESEDDYQSIKSDSFTYDDDEEYNHHQKEMARRIAEAGVSVNEERLRREEEQRKMHRQRIWRTLTGKKQNVGISSNRCCKMRCDEVIDYLRKQEFYNFNTRAVEDLVSSTSVKEGMVKSISFNGTDMFDEETKFPYNAQIDIVYHTLKRIKPPITSKSAKRRDIDDVMWEFTSAGFENVEKLAIPDLKKGWIVKEDSVEAITINGRTDFKKSDKICVNANVVISYHVFKSK
ncbi:hypothetical protein [Pseudobutyrivibrio sp. MD2005]|uniref:hypothetical protein n=1 Tax=Pseudobutyrivibrio sp. MD2005 TaxID=1410616 RepID=UPI000560F98B|nr:hypothetical protein [Pseudobutyrivibrio sp. MD2005]